VLIAGEERPRGARESPEIDGVQIPWAGTEIVNLYQSWWRFGYLKPSIPTYIHAKKMLWVIFTNTNSYITMKKV